MTTVQCVTCLHYLGSRTCDAFPIEIPEEIFTGLHDHREPFPADQDIRYEHNPDFPEDPTIMEDFDDAFEEE